MFNLSESTEIICHYETFITFLYQLQNFFLHLREEVGVLWMYRGTKSD